MLPNSGIPQQTKCQMLNLKVVKILLTHMWNTDSIMTLAFLFRKKKEIPHRNYSGKEKKKKHQDINKDQGKLECNTKRGERVEVTVDKFAFSPFYTKCHQSAILCILFISKPRTHREITYLFFKEERADGSFVLWNFFLFKVLFTFNKCVNLL